MWWHRLAAGIVGAIVALVALAGPVLAGGWAVTTIDALPDGGFVAGRTYRLGYTIRQHGQHPFAGAKTAITLIAPGSRDRHVFPGVPDGPAGHYVAEVTFPSEGAWDWEVSQEPFAVQTLGTITVGPAAVARPAESTTGSSTASAAPWVPVDVVGLSAGDLTWQVSLVTMAVLLVAIGLVVQPITGRGRRWRRGSEPSAAPIAPATE